ncbi:MAG TPA: lysylphosphatidylglycerol synthase transmembrane domain-containing protein [Terriglobales bacterium]
MKRKQILVLLVVMVVLAALVYLQIRAWRKFDWEKFEDGIAGINYLYILLAIGCIYLADLLRAVRWKIFLRPTRPDASWVGLIAPQYVGFTGLALLGRPGEFIRPYLIAKKENVTFSSQIAIWLVERVFDTGAVVLLFTIDVFTSQSLRELDKYDAWRKVGYIAAPGFAAFVLMIWALWVRGPEIARWLCRRLSRVSNSFSSSVEKKILGLSQGLKTIHDVRSLLQVSGISIVIWCLVALAYRQVTHAYPAATGLQDLDFPQVLLLMFASVAGGVIQLPLVGGGSQLATIAVLSQTFGYNDAPELAVSCGVLLWLVTFMSVIPAGVLLAHREHVSLRRLTKDSQQAEPAAEAALTSPSDERSSAI